MITCDMQGGLGNVMFQVATAYALAKRNGGTSYFDLSQGCKSCTQHFNTLKKYKTNIFSRLNDHKSIKHKNHYDEPHFHYSEIPYKDDLFIHGYFQSYRYFNDVRECILDLFKPNLENIERIYSEYGDILSNNCVSVHCRRGDYLKLSHIHPVQTKEYYINAMKFFDSEYKFLIFSDDIKWCKNNFDNENFKFVEGNEDWYDMYLMSLCDHNIICNSSFSWWGAWLNTNDKKKVIAPKKWFVKNVNHNITDLYEKEWILL